MPSQRLTTYIQNNFLVGERKTSTTLDRETGSSVQELVNYRVLKSGSIKRRLGTRQDFKITGALPVSDDILKFFVFADGYIVLSSNGRNNNIYYIPDSGRSVLLSIVPYKAVSYNISNLREDPIELDIGRHNTVLASKFSSNPDFDLEIKDIEILGKSIFVLLDNGLPYRIFAESGRIYLAPYYYTTDIGESFDSFIRSLPIDDLKVVFPDVFFNVGGVPVKSEESTLTVGVEDLDAGTCRAFLSFTGSDDVPSTQVDTAKMALKEYLFKPIIFNVLPTDPEIIPLDVGRKIVRGTDEAGAPTVELAYLSDWDAEASYSSTLLTNLDTQCRIREFSYSPVVNSSAEASVGDSEVIEGSKAQLIRELLYGRRYMIIPYETVGVQNSRVGYHTAFSLANPTAENITTVDVTFVSLATGLIRQNPATFSTFTIRDFRIGDNTDVNGAGTIKKNVSGITAVSNAGFNLLRSPFPDDYVNTVDGVAGTLFKDLPWDNVVEGSWRSFVGAYIRSTSTSITDSSVILVSDLNSNGEGVAEEVTDLLVHKADSVPNQIRGSAEIARYRYTSTNIGTTRRTRTYEYVGGGLVTETVPDTVTEEVTGFALEQDTSQSLTDDTESMSVNLDSNFNPTSLFIANDANDRYGYSIDSSGEIDEVERAFINFFRYTDDRNRNTLTACFLVDGRSFALYRSGGRWGYISIEDSIDDGDFILPGYRSSIRNFRELPSVDDDEDFVQAVSYGGVVYILFRVSRRNYKMYTFRARGSRLSRASENDISGDYNGFALKKSGSSYLVYFVDSFERLDAYSSSYTRMASEDILLHDRANEGYFLGDVFYAREDDSVYEYERIEQTRTSTVRNDNLETSIVDAFIRDEEASTFVGSSSVNITLVNNASFNGFEVMAYNRSTIAAFGYNAVSNNEYLSDNRNPTGSFDYPALKVGGTVALAVGSITAIGQHQIETVNGSFYTWFIQVRKGGDLSSFSTLYIRLGGLNGRTYTLNKQNFPNLEGNVEVFIEADADLRPVEDYRIDTDSNSSVEVFAEANNVSPYSFKDATFSRRIASVYANCLIFELGMPATSRRENGTRVIGGNDYDLGYSTNKVCYSNYNYDYDAFAVFNNNFALLRDDRVTFIYQNDNYANNLIRTLNGNPSDEIKDLFIKTEYIPSVFGNKFPSVISKYLLSPTSRAVDVITNSPQVVTFDNYINKVGFGSTAAYSRTVVNPRGRSVKLVEGVSSFDGESILASSEEGLYSIPVAPTGEATLVHNQRFKFKPLVFHNRFVFISPDDLLVTQYRSRERLGLKSNFSGADQINLLSKVEDIIFDQDTQSYMMIDSDGAVVVATDFDTTIGGFAKWNFGVGVESLKLLATPTGIKGIFKRALERSNLSELHILSFDDSITEDYKDGFSLGESFESKFVSNTLLNPDSAVDTGLYRGYIKKFELSSSLCAQVTVSFQANGVSALSYDYIRQNAKGEVLEYQSPIDCLGKVLGYNPRIVVTQSDVTDCNGIIYGFKYQGALNGV